MQNTSESKNAPSYSYVDTLEKLERLICALRGEPRVGFDTEADSLHHYFEKVCLLQLSFSGHHYIVDPLAGFSLESLWPALRGKTIIFHAADYDLRMLKKSFGFQPDAPVFDTMLAAQMLGFEKFGLAALVEKICGVLLPKTGQKADWSRRPLTQSLLQYASDDTKYLERLADHLTEKLTEAGRLEWHRQACERAVRTASMEEKEEARETWRIKGSFKMTPLELHYLKTLWGWRDEEARRRDRPPFMILRNEDLLELTMWRAQNPEAPLEKGPSFVKRISGEKHDRLVSALLAAQSTPRQNWPQPPEKKPYYEAQPSSEKVEALLVFCREIAADLKMESSVIASRAALTRVIQHRPQSVEKAVELCGLMPWQAELMMPAIRSVLKQ